MTFSLCAGPQEAYRKQKHQMSVTHSSLGLHKPGNPRSGPELVACLPGVAAVGKARRGRQPYEMATRHERFVAFEGVYPEKALSMRTSQGCPHSQGLHAETGNRRYREGRKGCPMEKRMMPPRPNSPPPFETQ